MGLSGGGTAQCQTLFLSVLDSTMLGTMALNPLNGGLWTQPRFIVKSPHKLLIDLTGLDPNPGSVD